MPKHFVLSVVFILSFLFSGAQHGRLLKKGKLISGDSVVQEMKKQQNSADVNQTGLNTVEIREGISGRVETLIQEEKKRQARQLRGSYIRIGVGIAMLVVLVIGLKRKKNPAA